MKGKTYIAKFDSSRGDLLSQVPNLLMLLHILRNNTIYNLIARIFKQLEHFVKVCIVFLALVFLFLFGFSAKAWRLS